MNMNLNEIFFVNVSQRWKRHFYDLPYFSGQTHFKWERYGHFSDRWLAEQATTKLSCSKTLLLVNSVYTNNVLSARVHV